MSDFIEMMHKVNPDAPYKQFANEINPNEGETGGDTP